MTEGAIGRYERFNFLRRIAALRGLSEGDLYNLVDAADKVELAAGDPLTEDGVGDDGVWAVSTNVESRGTGPTPRRRMPPPESLAAPGRASTDPETSTD